jgi:hypothetical protein
MKYENARSNRWLTVVLITPEVFGVDPSTIFRTYGASREDVRLALEGENIEAKPLWKPMHLQPVFQVEALSAKGMAGSGKSMALDTRMTEDGRRVAEGGKCRALSAKSIAKRTEVGCQRSEVRRANNDWKRGW